MVVLRMEEKQKDKQTLGSVGINQSFRQSDGSFCHWQSVAPNLGIMTCKNGPCRRHSLRSGDVSRKREKVQS